MVITPCNTRDRDIEVLLRADDLDAGGAIDRLLAFTGGHPQRTVLLAHHVYNLLDQSGQPEDLVTAAIDLALAETRDAHQAVWDGLGRVERIVLLELADGQAPAGRRVADEHRIARTTLQDALERLLADERNVQRVDRARPFVLDPPLRRVAKTPLSKRSAPGAPAQSAPDVQQS